MLPRTARNLVAVSRRLKVSAAQLGPIHRADSRKSVVKRLVEMLKEADLRGSKFVVFPELALTTFFPRWWMERPGRGRQVFRGADAEPRDAAAVRAGALQGHRLLPGLCRADGGGGQDPALQHLDPGRARTAGPSASTARSICRAMPSTGRRRPTSISRRSTSRSATWASTSGRCSRTTSSSASASATTGAGPRRSASWG